MGKGEDRLVAWLAGRRAGVATPGGGLLLGIGDDMAMLKMDGGVLLVTADMLMDGVHFDSSVHGPAEIGRKALAASLSDCAAMAVRPRWALVSVGLPEAWAMADARALFEGMEALAAEYECTLAGGDTNSWSRPLVVDVSVLAEPFADVAPVRRDGARAGDALCVTGRLGGSLRGHHLTFRPRVREAHALARGLGESLHAMMDLSDGLSTDAQRMAASSACGLVFEETLVETVVSSAARAASTEDGRTALAHALHDGEDYELLFAAEPGAMEQWAGADGEAEEGWEGLWTRVGFAVAEAGVWLQAADGVRKPLEAGGWQHFR